MKVHILTLFAAIAMLFGACSHEDLPIDTLKAQLTAPQMMASVEQEPITRSGVIEDNDDYKSGEKFYWINGDATTVFFKNAGTSSPTQYKKAEYAASVAEGVKNNSSTFNVTQADVIANGEYTAYGFFPTAAWKTQTNVGDFLMADVPVYQIQDKANSAHLGAYMLMKAENEVTVDGSSPIKLTYKQLASVIRVVVQNNTRHRDYLRLTNINLKLRSGKAVFASRGRLDNIGDGSLSIQKQTNVPQLTLQLKGDAQEFSTKNGKNVCEGYIAVLPTTDAWESSDNIEIELSFTTGTGNYRPVVAYYTNPLSAGIEQGKSYYFNLKVSDADLSTMNAPSYVVGDYWPDRDNPQGIVFWVKPGSFGTKGKVVALGETYVTKWGSDKDEQALDITGIRSLTDGFTATKSMIRNHSGSGIFNENYPPFHYIYNTVNGRNLDGDWYLPARDELKMLYAGYSGRIYESIVGWQNSDMPDYNSSACRAARSAFNAKLTAKGGQAFGGSNRVDTKWWYFSSSEIAATKCYSFNLEKGSSSIDDKSVDGNIRWIRNF